ncbi:MAG: peptidoglycan-binding protein [Eubacteriales bacterium]|nr:peptidoglycan-binding protein [Eubacteriales bacterium]
MRRFKRMLAVLAVCALLAAYAPALAENTAVVTADSLNVYTTPYVQTAEIAGTIRKGTEVTVSAVSNGLAKIVVKGNIYYVDADKLSFGLEPAPGDPVSPGKPEENEPTYVERPAYVTASKLTIYASASKEAEVLGTASKGVELTVLATSGAWAAVRVAGKTGYCAYAGLSIYPGSGSSSPSVSPDTDDDDREYTVNGAGACIALDDLRMYKQPDTSDGYYGSFKAGTTIEVTAVSGKWAKIQYKGQTGYVLRAGLRPATQADGSTSDNNASASGYTHQTINQTTLYQKPNTSSDALKILPTGTKVSVKALSGGWAKIEYSGVNCYALEKNLIESTAKATAMVIVAEARVYSSAGTGASVLGKISEGNTIDVYAAKNGWAGVLYNGQKGYMRTDDLYSGSASYASLKAGDSGTNVQALQNRLETLGYFDGVPAGNYGSITTAAVKRFQEQRGLNVTGVANNATQAALYTESAPVSKLLSQTISAGSPSEYVTRLQTRLLYKNYYSDTVDGDYGSNTTNAVRAFQKNVNMTQTGVADPATLKALFAPGAPKGTIERPAGSNGTPSLDPPNVTGDNEDIETVIRYALAQLGKPYVYGSAGPNSFDCSGLTYYCFKKVGITLPRSARDVGYSTALGERIPYDELQRGDIVCFNTISDSDLSDHVGIYLGDGKFIHAPHTGSDVIVASMSSGYYVRNFSWARRVIK